MGLALVWNDLHKCSVDVMFEQGPVVRKPPPTRMTASMRLIMSWNRRWIWRCGIARHSWCNTADNSGKMWTGGCLWRARRPRMFHKFSVELKTGFCAGQGMVVIAFRYRKSIAARVSWPKLGCQSEERQRFLWYCPLRLPWTVTRSHLQLCETHVHTITELPLNGMDSWMLLAA